MEKITIHKEVNHLLHDGYQFRKVWIMSDGTTCWRCVKRNCRSRLRVNEKDNVVSFSVHNHNPALEPCESKKTIAEMCHIDVEKPQHIILKAAAAIPLSNGTECIASDRMGQVTKRVLSEPIHLDKDIAGKVKAMQYSDGSCGSIVSKVSSNNSEKSSRPDTSNKTAESFESIESMVLDCVPKKWKTQASRLLTYMKNNTNIRWNATGTLVLKNKPVVKTHAVDLVNYMLRKRTSIPSPSGWKQLAEALKDTKIPHKLVTNAECWKYINSLPERGDRITHLNTSKRLKNRLHVWEPY